MTIFFEIPLAWVNIYLICGLLIAELFKTHSANTHGSKAVGHRFGPYMAMTLLWALIVPLAVATVVFASTSRTRP